MRSSFRHYGIVYGRFRSLIAVPLFVRCNAARIALHECPKSLMVASLHPFASAMLKTVITSGTIVSNKRGRQLLRLDTTPADRSASSGTTHKTCYIVIVPPIAKGIVCRFVRKTCFSLGNPRMEEEFIGNVWKFTTTSFFNFP